MIETSRSQVKSTAASSVAQGRADARSSATPNYIEQNPPEELEGSAMRVLSTEDLLDKLGEQAWGPLEPSAACALSSCSRDLRAAMLKLLPPLRAQHEAAAALAAKVGVSCAALRESTWLGWASKGLTATHAHTLGALLGSGAMPLVEVLLIGRNDFGDEGVRALCDGLGRGVAPRLTYLDLANLGIGPASADALGAALGRGALPALRNLGLWTNRLGDAGLAALAAPLRRLPGLEVLYLQKNEISDAGVAALVGGAPPLKALKTLNLAFNRISDAGCAELAAALDGGALPALARLGIDGMQAGSEARQAVAASRR